MELEIGRDGESRGRRVTWLGDKPVVIGRSRDVEIHVPDPLLSRRQCRLEMDHGRPFVVDLDSANGTFVNTERIGRAPFTERDLVTFGRTWMRMITPERASPRAEDTTELAGEGSAKDLPAPTPQDLGVCWPDTIEGYQLVEAIGRGSFGVVYRARHRLLGREVAIKLLPTAGAQAKAEASARFLREIRAMGELSHPNLVSVHGAGEGEGYAYLVMELVRGDTVARRLRDEGRMRIPEALAVARQVALALEHAYSRGYVHRDVKPENILLTEDGQAKLVDFGLVKSLGATSSEGLMRPGQGFGSVAYMPPEQVRAAKSADQRADVYSLGATLYTMLTGERPFQGKVTRQLLKRVMEEMPPTVRERNPLVPQALSDLVERCMRKALEERFQTPQALREALDLVAVAIARETPPSRQDTAELPPISALDPSGSEA